MKKLSLIVAHTDIVNVMSELISLKCLEPTVPELTLDPPELTDLLNREVMELEAYDANYENITILSTQYTYIITGWLPAVHEPVLTSMLAKYMCAWKIQDLSSLDHDIAPITIKYPQFFGKLRSGGRRLFVPLSKSHSS